MRKIPLRPVGVRSRHVNAWLDAKVAQEPTHEESILRWLQFDARRPKPTKEQLENDRILNIK